MDNEGTGDRRDSPLSPETNPRDGLINFAEYSLAQLQELQFSVDRHAFPQNFNNLMAEIERREKPNDQLSTSGSLFAGRFTSREGLRGWLRAKRERYPVYGDGSIEVRSTDVVLRGWQRTWLGIPLQSEVSIPINTIRNCVQEGLYVRFDFKQRLRLTRRVRFQAATEQQAGSLAASLPKVYVAGFEKRWSEIREFNRRVAALGHRVRATPALVVTNTAIFIAMVVVARFGTFGPQQLLNWGANFGPLTVNGQWWRLVTALFVHFNIAHLVLNMWALWNVGRLAERLYGTRIFLVLYFVSGAFASLTSIAWDPSHTSAGASGAIFGILGAFIAFLAHQQTHMPAAIVRAHWISTLAFVLFNLVSGALQPGIDNAAHIGGLLSGYALGLILARPLDAERREHLPFGQSLIALGFIAAIAMAGIWQVRGIGAQLTIPEHYFRTHAWYASGESSNLRLWQQLAAQATAGAISDAEVGQRFQRDILPFWQTANERLQNENQSIQGAQRPFALLVADFVRLRLDWAQAVIDSTVNSNASRLHDAIDLAKQTDLAQARIERIGIRASMDHRPRALAHSPFVVRIRNLFSVGQRKCIEFPPFIGIPVATTDSRADGPAMRDAAGCLAQRLFMTGDYDSLESMMRRASTSMPDLPDGGSTYAGIVGGLMALFDYGTLDPLEAFGRTSDWRRVVKDSVAADLVEAMLFRTWAWSVRGHGYANSVSTQAWALFAHRTEMAAATLKDTADRASANPLWYQLSLSVGRDQSLGVDDLRAIFDQGIARFPQYLPLYGEMLRISMPRWGGSYEKVNQLITDASAKSSIDSGQELYARLYWMYSSLEDDDIDIFTDASANWQTMKQGFKALINRYPTSDVVLNAFEKFACIGEDAEQYRAARSGVESHLAATAWSDKVSLKVCDGKFAEQAARGYIDEGNALLNGYDFDHAIADFDKAIASDPKAAMAYANRGMAYLWKHNNGQAGKDFDSAFAIDSRNPVVFRGRGMLAQQAGQFDQAIAAFSKALEVEPADVFALQNRARTYEDAGEDDKALADSAEVVRLTPTFVDSYWFRAMIFRTEGDTEKAIAEATALTAANPNDARAYIVAGGIYSALKRNVEAMRAFDRALEIAPTPSTYLARAKYRQSKDISGKRADIDAALKLNPNSVNAMAMRAQMQSDSGQFADAIATLNAAMEIQVGSYSLRVARGIAYAKTDQSALSEADFTAARRFATDAAALNDMCWTMGTSGVALAMALDDCDAALAKAPAARAIIDSRAFVLLRLARYDDAITAYDAALRIRPKNADSLYGRGIAKRRRGDIDAGAADIKAALAADADIAATFANYGVTP